MAETENGSNQISRHHLPHYISPPKAYEIRKAKRDLLINAKKNAEIVNKLQDMAFRDKLTGLYNRSFFEEKVVPLMEETISQKEPVSVISIDIDHFKNVNDNYGHAAGDRVLARVAQEIALNIQADDISVRFGGEEFLVVLLKTAGNTAYAIAERIRSNVPAIEKIFNQGKPLTLSLGVADSLQLGINSHNILLETADKALYQSKHHGRNQTTLMTPRLYQELLQPPPKT